MAYGVTSLCLYSPACGITACRGVRRPSGKSLLLNSSDLPTLLM